jgi:hypothetical protein
MFILQCLLLTLPLLFKIHQMFQRSKMPLWINLAKILRPYWRHFMMVLRIIKPRNFKTVEEFWQHGDKDYRDFEHGKLLAPKHVHLKVSWIMQKFHKLFYLACVSRLNLVKLKFLETFSILKTLI